MTVTKKQNNFQITPSYFSNFFCCSNIYFCEFLSCFNFMIFFFWVKMNYFYTGSWSISATSTSKYSGRGSRIFWKWVIKENQNEISKNFYLEKKCIHFVSVIVVCFHIFYYAKKKKTSGRFEFDPSARPYGFKLNFQLNDYICIS